MFYKTKIMKFCLYETELTFMYMYNIDIKLTDFKNQK